MSIQALQVVQLIQEQLRLQADQLAALLPLLAAQAHEIASPSVEVPKTDAVSKRRKLAPRQPTALVPAAPTQITKCYSASIDFYRGKRRTHDACSLW